MAALWMKRTVVALAGLALVAGLAWALREQPVRADIGKVATGAMKISILQEGLSQVRDVYEISAPIAGKLMRGTLQEGDRVKAGATIIAAIQPPDPPLIDRRTMATLDAARDAASAAVAAAEAELKRVETHLDFAANDHDRALRLAASGFITTSRLESLANEEDMARAQVEAARSAVALRQAELANADAQLALPGSIGRRPGECCINMTAPVDGVVLTIFARDEQSVSAGMKIMEIGDPARLQVEVDLLSTDAVRIKIGAKARIIDWGGDRALDAVVERIDPTGFTKVSALGIEEQRVHAVLALVQSDPRLGHDFRVTADIIQWETPSCMQVPISALFRTHGNWSVFHVLDGRARLTKVEIGHMNDDVAEIIDGLRSGDAVVLHPSDTIADGSLLALSEN